ncbi:MAG: serine hydroxymethyltransferase, partial [Ruthenibacterium sp.]
QSPFITSGLRIGTPAITTRGMVPADMAVIAECIANCVFDFEAKKEETRTKVAALTARYPLYE